MIQTPPPPPPQGATPKVSIPGVADGAPQALPTTAAEIQRLRAKGRELSNQLSSATDRREDVLRELRKASTDARPGLEARLKVLDDRIVSLEQEIAYNSRMIANAPLELTSRSEAPPAGRRSGPDPEVMGVIGLLIALPVAIGFTVRLLRRPSVPAGPSPRDAQQDERLARMEQAIDTMAVELERITEGQRFMTKLMTDEGARALSAGAGAAEPIAARDAARQERR